MKSMNLYLLTRTAGSAFPALARELTGDAHKKEFSVHEIRSLCALVDQAVPVLKDRCAGEGNWVRFLDGFYFSYTIAHVSKEFDLIKISEDGNCVLNIELKSEAIEEDRILKQLSQNRYYLSHISRTIYSFTYVMETNTLYFLNDRGYMRAAGMEELADVLMKPAFSSFVEKDLDQYFRAADYLISPAALPEKFLQGNYFLTNQQFEFRRRILQYFDGEQADGSVPVVAVSGSAGAGKTLLLFDLAMELSKKKRVLILQGGKLQKGHRLIDERLRNVFIRTADSSYGEESWDYVLVDETSRIDGDALDGILAYVRARRTPCVMAYDPHTLVDQTGPEAGESIKIREACGLYLEFTGNIRINRPVYAFMRELFRPREKAKSADYSCIDVVFADDREAAAAILAYYRDKGYQKITLPGGGGAIGEGLMEDEIIGLVFECVLVILDSRFYYDGEDRLRAAGDASEEAVNILYEGISRTREKLCVLVLEDEALFARILSIREQDRDSDRTQGNAAGPAESVIETEE